MESGASTAAFAAVHESGNVKAFERRPPVLVAPFVKGRHPKPFTKPDLARLHSCCD
jgi:hypothetical protein